MIICGGRNHLVRRGDGSATANDSVEEVEEEGTTRAFGPLRAVVEREEEEEEEILERSKI